MNLDTSPAEFTRIHSRSPRKAEQYRQQRISELAEQAANSTPTERDHYAQRVPAEVEQLIKRCLVIDPESPSGLSWKVARRSRGGHAQPGKMAGSLRDASGYKYWYVGIGHKHLMASHVVYFLHNDRWPVGQVDHIDGDSTNNRPGNLRDVTAAQNQQNRPAKGYYYSKREKRYHAKIKINGSCVSLGMHKTEEEARAAYIRAKLRLHPLASSYAYDMPAANDDCYDTTQP